jgi:hypothetical protein
MSLNRKKEEPFRCPACNGQDPSCKACNGTGINFSKFDADHRGQDCAECMNVGIFNSYFNMGEPTLECAHAFSAIGGDTVCTTKRTDRHFKPTLRELKREKSNLILANGAKLTIARKEIMIAMEEIKRGEANKALANLQSALNFMNKNPTENTRLQQIARLWAIKYYDHALTLFEDLMDRLVKEFVSPPETGTGIESS